MADLPQQDTIKQYLADGVQDTFAAPFFVPLETDGEPNIDVYVQLQGAAPIPESDIKVWGVDYTFTTNLDPITGGTVNFLPGKIPANDSVVTLVRDVQASLDVEFSNAQTFNGQNLDDALDKLLLIEQQNKTYCLQRNLSYIVNSYLPDATRTANVQIPLLESQQVWMGSAGGVIAATLEQNPDVSTLRSELANASPGTDGARLVGYYDTVNLLATTVNDFLTSLNTSTFRMIGHQSLTGSGTYTPTAGTKFCWARGVAAGGGGGGATSTGGTVGVGGGGAAGGYGEAWFAAATLAFACGAGGGAGSPGGAGGTGGNTTLGSILSLTGGGGGNTASSIASEGWAPGGVGGYFSTADVGFRGECGDFGWIDTTGGVSGKGGSTQFGSGGLSVAGATTQNGNSGGNGGYGNGGSGGLTIGATNATGGVGGDGFLLITEYGYAA